MISMGYLTKIQIHVKMVPLVVLTSVLVQRMSTSVSAKMAIALTVMQRLVQVDKEKDIC